MSQPLSSLASADRRQREQSAAATPPSQAAASPIPQVGVFALAAIAHIPVPKVVKQ